MSKIASAILTGWLSFIWIGPDSFGSFLGFLVLWIVMGVPLIFFTEYLIGLSMASKPIHIIPIEDVKPTPIKLDGMEAIFGKSIYTYSEELFLADKEIRKYMFPIAVQNMELDFSHMWYIFHTDTNHIDYELSPQPMDPTVKSLINSTILSVLFKVNS